MTNYFETLSDAVYEAERRACAKGADFDNLDLYEAFSGGVSYGQTVRAAIKLISYKGRASRMALTVVIYRVESGKYELTSYIN